MNKLNALIGQLGFSIFLSFSCAIYANGQSIWTNPITGTDPGLTSPYTTGDVFDANITVSGISRGAGVTGAAGLNRYNSSSWNTAAIDLTAYFEFTLTPDAGCEIDLISFVYTSQRSNVSIANFAFRSSVDGFATNIGAPDFDGTTIDLSAAAYQNITSAITFRFYAWGASAVGNTFSINDFTFNGTVTCGCSGPVAQPTTETSADLATPSCVTANITWVNGNGDNVLVVVSTAVISDAPTDGVAYTANSTFGSGEELVLSDGQFVVYNGSGTSANITGLTIGTTYNYAIFGYDGIQADCEENYLTGGNFGSFTTLTSCGTAQITTLMVNSCSGSSEGTDELIVIENGDEAINIDDMIISLPNSTWCNSGCGANTLVNNATYVSQLCTLAGCSPDLFVYADPIPAGATIIIFTGDPPTTVLDYSSNCGAPGAPIYVIFLNNNSITGNFANTGSTIKIIDIDFGNGQSDVVSYIPDDVANVDGGSILYDDAGNPSYYTSTDCVYPLSLRLTAFSALKKNKVVQLNWTSYAESTLSHFLVERSTDGESFQIIGEVQREQALYTLYDYSFLDYDLPIGAVIYYRLTTVDEYGIISYSGVVSVENAHDGVYYDQQNLVVTSDQINPANQPYFIYSSSGALIAQGSTNENGLIPFVAKGVFILNIPGLRIRQKIVCL